MKFILNGEVREELEAALEVVRPIVRRAESKQSEAIKLLQEAAMLDEQASKKMQKVMKLVRDKTPELKDKAFSVSLDGEIDEI